MQRISEGIEICSVHTFPWYFALMAYLPCCSKFPPPAHKNIFVSSFCHLNIWIQLPGIVPCFVSAKMNSYLVPAFFFSPPQRTSSMKVESTNEIFCSLLLSESFPKHGTRPKMLQNKHQRLFPWLAGLLHSNHTACVFSNFSTSLKNWK